MGDPRGIEGHMHELNRLLLFEMNYLIIKHCLFYEVINMSRQYNLIQIE